MSVTSEETIAKMQALFETGHSIRETARIVGVHQDTVRRHYRKGPARTCACGKPLTHKGWCAVRVARSPGIQLALLRMGKANEATIKRWHNISALNSWKRDYIEVSARLENAWVKQAIMRENSLLGEDKIIQLAWDAVNSRIYSPLISEDIVHDLIVLMLEGKLEAEKIKKSKLLGRMIEREFRMIWASSTISLHVGWDENGQEELLSFLPQESAPMTKDEFMEISWRDFILWAHSQPEIRNQFSDETGIRFIAPAANALEAAIDDVTDAHSKLAEEFVKWVTERHWGTKDAPAEWKKRFGYR